MNAERNKIKAGINNHFIGSWLMNEKNLNEIIDFFNSSHESHTAGKVGNGNIDKTKKDCIELLINPREIEEKKLEFLKNFLSEIKNCFVDYTSQWDYLDSNWNKMYIGSVLIQKFLASGHHTEYHCDRQNINSSHKSLSWITFLNNIEENEGLMDFKYFECSIKPKKGLTLMWPSDWTHLHRQNLLKSQDKFIIKGNIQFIDI